MNLDYPIKEFSLEVTNKCNFHCNFCPYDDMSREHGQMPLELAQKLIDEVVDKKLARAAGMQIMGEPMMYRHFFEVLDHSKSRGLPLWVTTNGSFLNSKTIPRLLEGAIESLQISYQTTNEKTYTQRGTSLGFDKYRGRIEELIRYRLHNESPTEINIFILCTMHNILKKPRIIDRFQDVTREVDRWIQFIESEGGKPDREKTQSDIDYYKKWSFDYSRDSRIRLAPGINIRINNSQRWGPWVMDTHGVRTTPSREGTCGIPFQQFHVLWDGRVTFCCFDYDGALTVGNLNEMTIEELLDGPLGEAKEEFRRSELTREFCQRCRGRLNFGDLAKAVDPGAVLRLSTNPVMMRSFYRRVKNAGFIKKISTAKTPHDKKE